MLPRPVLPCQFYLVTRRCTQRQFLLRPDRETNNAFTYALIDAAQRAQIDVLLPCAMSNHYHAVIFDRFGRYPEFVEHFHKMFARSQNALRGRWENFWSSEQVCVVRLVDREDVMDKLVYTATNPVKDGLVDRVHHWPGVNGLGALLAGRPLRAHRPLHFYRRNGMMPDAVELVQPAGFLTYQTGTHLDMRWRSRRAPDRRPYGHRTGSVPDSDPDDRHVNQGPE